MGPAPRFKRAAEAVARAGQLGGGGCVATVSDEDFAGAVLGLVDLGLGAINRLGFGTMTGVDFQGGEPCQRGEVGGIGGDQRPERGPFGVAVVSTGEEPGAHRQRNGRLKRINPEPLSGAPDAGFVIGGAGDIEPGARDGRVVGPRALQVVQQGRGFGVTARKMRDGDLAKLNAVVGRIGFQERHSPGVHGLRQHVEQPQFPQERGAVGGDVPC